MRQEDNSPPAGIRIKTDPVSRERQRELSPQHGDSHIYSHLKDKRVTERSRPAWSTHQVPGPYVKQNKNLTNITSTSRMKHPNFKVPGLHFLQNNLIIITLFQIQGRPTLLLSLLVPLNDDLEQEVKMPQ